MSSSNLIIEVTGEGREVNLPQSGQLVIGSDPERTDLTLDDQGIAPVHCTVGRIRGGGWALKDMGSDYGSLVNGRPATTVRLMHGDVIVIGSKHLRIKDPSLPQEPNVDEPAPQAKPSPPPTHAPAPAARSSQPKSGAPDLPGYRLDSLLGRGGMGQVWLATQVSLDRRVAIKVLSAGLEADSAFVDRFQAEARAAAALAHPNVVTVHDVSEANGHHFLTMEYMGGGCLESRLAELGPVPWQEALSILRDAARGLEYAESKGIVHRDIKPANLMCSETGLVKIADLGLAGSVEQDETTEGGKIFGTPHFIAPEVVRGNRADARSDLYSLGATAYRIISGHTPFEGESSKEILRQVLHEEAPDLRDFAPEIPDGVNSLIARLLAKKPEERPPSAAILLREIERLLTHQGQNSDTQGTPGSTKKAPVGLILGALAVVVLGTIFGGGGEDPIPTPKPTPNEPEVPQTGPTPTEGQADSGGDGQGEDTPEVPEQRGDQSEQLVELEAENALYKLSDRSLTDENRIIELRAVAKRYLGTNAGRRAGEEASLLTARIAAEAEATAARGQLREGLLESMKLAAAPFATQPGSRPTPGHALRALAAVPGQQEWNDDQVFLDARGVLQHTVLANALAWTEERWAAALKLRDAGDFKRLDEILVSILPPADLPPLWEGTPQATQDCASALQKLGREVSDTHDMIPVLESQHYAERSQADIEAIAKGVGPSSGVRTLVRNIDLASLAERLSELQQGLSSPAARATLTSLGEKVEAGHRALESLVTTWEQGRWKRHQIQDPNGGRTSLLAAGADSTGLRLMIDGVARHTPWSAWQDNTRAFENLFTGRLDRAWTGPEIEDISSALMLASISQALGHIQGLVGGTGSFKTSLPRSAAQDIEGSFATAMEWAERAPQEGGAETARVEIAREAAVSKILIAAWLAGKDGRWAEAASALEFALREYPGSFLVLLLSDGTEIGKAPATTPSKGDKEADDDPVTLDGEGSGNESD
ncbi:MAG: serine/threonine-protein kinase [Planctomycetota bacterium]|nr:serine/threonine-protein kinase [Planctomycetota bacterium]